MAPGYFSTRMIAQTKSIALDPATGQQSAVWTDAQTFWGQVVPMTAHEIKRAMQYDGVQRIEIRANYSATRGALTAKDRINEAETNRIYQLVGQPMKQDNRRYLLTFICEEAAGEEV